MAALLEHSGRIYVIRYIDIIIAARNFAFVFTGIQFSGIIFRGAVFAIVLLQLIEEVYILPRIFDILAQLLLRLKANVLNFFYLRLAVYEPLGELIFAAFA